MEKDALEKSSIRELVTLFFAAQERRPGVYQTFDSEFEAYLEHNSVELFQQRTQAITQEFQKISASIIEIEKELIARNENKIASLIRKLQNLERDLLQTTVGIQLLKKKIQEIQVRQEEEEKANAHGHSHSLSLDHEGDEFEIDIANAELKERKCSRGSVMESINSILDELREILIDLE